MVVVRVVIATNVVSFSTLEACTLATAPVNRVPTRFLYPVEQVWYSMVLYGIQKSWMGMEEPAIRNSCAFTCLAVERGPAVSVVSVCLSTLHVVNLLISSSPLLLFLRAVLGGCMSTACECEQVYRANHDVLKAKRKRPWSYARREDAEPPPQEWAHDYFFYSLQCQSSVTAVYWMPDGHSFLTAGQDGLVKVGGQAGRQAGRQ